MIEKPVRLVTRLTTPFKQITLPQDIEFPAKDKLSYDNYLIGVLDAQQYVQYNFLFSNGLKSQVKSNSPLQELRIHPQDRPIKRVILWYDSVDAQLVGL